MKNRIFALILCICMMLGMVPAVHAVPHREPVEAPSVDRCCQTLRTDIAPNAFRPDFGGKLLEVTPQRVEDTFDYLNEVYIQKHPEAALVMDVADEEDRAAIAALAQEITAGCTTDRQKAEAIDAWMLQSNGNIIYDVDASAYANDTYYDRIGNCLSYANLMQLMLRSLGIPAVVGDGWRGDMAIMGVELFNYVGHAWCFAYIGGQWVLYDPLWIVGGTTDRDYIAKNIYLDQVEVITPASDENNLPPETYDRFKVYYTNGRWYMHSNDRPNGVGVFTSFINNQMFQFVGCQDEGDISDGWDYVDGQSDDNMVMGEVYRNGWVSYGGFVPTYAHVNGMMIDGAIMKYEGKDLYLRGSEAWPLLVSPENYSIQYGTITFQPGYQGKVFAPAWGTAYDWDTWETYTTTWTSQNPDIVSVTNDGTITCHKNGTASILLEHTRDSDGAFMSSKTISVSVSDVKRDPGLPEHTHSHTLSETVPATCTAEGYTTYTCACGDRYTETTPALGHDWAGTICNRCGEEREVPFSDVPSGSWYAEPVLWATNMGITDGMGNDSFGSDMDCNRAQVVTFLWRAAGSPEPDITTCEFTDVELDKWYSKAVLWALETGVTQGMGDGTFGLTQPCNRATVVTFLHRALNKPEPTSTECPFTDVPEKCFYRTAVLWAVENSITNGMGGTIFGSEEICNRAQVVTFLYRALAE